MSEKIKFADKDTQAVWDMSRNYHTDLQPDTEAGLRRLRKKIQAEKGQVRTVSLRSIIMRAAAAVLLLAVTAFGVNRFFSGTAEMITVTAQQSNEEVNLPDGSQVWLNKDAVLSYNVTFADAKRRLQLEGEAFFDVTHNPDQPFVITAGTGTVTVLGTSFLVNTSADKTEVAVKTGKVAFKADAAAEPVYLTKNMSAVSVGAGQPVSVSDKTDWNTAAWQSGVLTYRGAPLSDIIADVAAAYSVSVELENKNLAVCRYTDKINLSDRTPEQALSAVLQLTGLKMTQTAADTYRLIGGKNDCR